MREKNTTSPHTDDDEALRMVVSHYRSDAFKARRNPEFLERRNTFAAFMHRRAGVAAAVFAGVVLTAAAAWWIVSPGPQVPVSATDEVVEETHAYTRDTRLILEFDDAPLEEVVTAIEQSYNVRLTNVPEDAPRLTLRFEGDADELVEVINQLLDTKISISD